MESSVLDSLPPKGLSPGREPSLVSLQAPSQLSAQQTRTRPWDIPLSIPLSTLSWAPRLLQLREGCTDHVAIMHCSRGLSCSDHVAIMHYSLG